MSEQICELIKDETGITLDPSEIRYTQVKEVQVYLFEEKFTNIDADYLDESEDEDLAYMIVESVDRLAKRVTENRLRYLEGIIEPIIRGIEKEKAIALYFELEDRGCLERTRHYLNEREYEWDYPDIVLIVKKEKSVFEFPVDPYQIDEPFDLSELQEKL